MKFRTAPADTMIVHPSGTTSFPSMVMVAPFTMVQVPETVTIWVLSKTAGESTPMSELPLTVMSSVASPPEGVMVMLGLTMVSLTVPALGPTVTDPCFASEAPSVVMRGASAVPPETSPSMQTSAFEFSITILAPFSAVRFPSVSLAPDSTLTTTPSPRTPEIFASPSTVIVPSPLFCAFPVITMDPTDRVIPVDPALISLNSA